MEILRYTNIVGEITKTTQLVKETERTLTKLSTNNIEYYITTEKKTHNTNKYSRLIKEIKKKKHT